jgi:hypothetical protein
VSITFAGETSKSQAGTGRRTRPSTASITAAVVPASGTALEQLVALTGRDAELWVGPELEGEAGRRRRLEEAATALLRVRGERNALRAAALYREVLAEPAVLNIVAYLAATEQDEAQVEAQPEPVVHTIARPSLDRTVATVLERTTVRDMAVVTVALAPVAEQPVTHAVRTYQSSRPVVDGILQLVEWALVGETGHTCEQLAKVGHAREVDGIWVDVALRGVRAA